MSSSAALADTPRILVLGGGFAGVLAARRLGSALRGDASIRLVNDRDTFVERVRLHQIATGQDVVRPRIAQMIGNHAATFTRGRVTSLDTAERTVCIRHGDKEETAGYDVLVYALGSTIDLDSVPGVRACCASLADEGAALDMMQRLGALQKNGSGNVVVCGGGLTGIELAAEIAETFPSLRTSLVTAGRFGETFSPSGRAHVERAFERLRVDVREQTSVVSVRSSELVVEDGAPLPFDLCVWAASFAVPDLAQKAGLEVDRKNRVVVDAQLRSVSDKHVFAAGDCAIPLPSVCVPIRMGCATAMPMAGLVSDNVARAVRGRALESFRYAYLAQFVSLGRRDALAQFVCADDSPRAFVLGGRLAVWMKELTFRMNMFSLGTGFYPWRLAMLGAPIA